MQNAQLPLIDGHSIDSSLLRLLEHGFRADLSSLAEWQTLFTGQKRQIAALIEAEYLIQRGDVVVVNRVQCRRAWRYFGVSALPDFVSFVEAICDGRFHTTREIARTFRWGNVKLAHAHWLDAICIEADTIAGRIYSVSPQWTRFQKALGLSCGLIVA